MFSNMAKILKRIKDIFNRKQSVIIETICESVEYDNCNDYGYIVITFGGHSANLICPKCNGKCNSNEIKNNE